MKRYVLLLIVLMANGVVFAQDFDNRPSINIENKKEDLKFTIGARFMADVAYYHADDYKMKSGAAITDARIRTSMTYKNWYFYADFDFSKGKFSQKNIFLRHTFDVGDASHVLRVGYFNNPATMANNTSRGSLHFISRAAPVQALAPGRELGINYQFHNPKFLLSQGVFAENKYNDQLSGFQGFTFGGRWIWRPITKSNRTLHIGGSFRYAKICTGLTINGVLKTNLDLGTSLETYVDPAVKFLSKSMPWAKHDYFAGGEFLYTYKKMFMRGEYLYRHVAKSRDDEAVFEGQLESEGAIKDFDEWQKANPLSNDSFHGGYIEGGYRFIGDDYIYGSSDGVLKGLGSKTLEGVVRYSYLNLDGSGVDTENNMNTIFNSGQMHSATLGTNYSFNKYVQLLFSYTYTHLKSKVFDESNFNTLQARITFQF